MLRERRMRNMEYQVFKRVDDVCGVCVCVG
jgi:hypothetical protein